MITQAVSNRVHHAAAVLCCRSERKPDSKTRIKWSRLSDWRMDGYARKPGDRSGVGGGWTSRRAK